MLVLVAVALAAAGLVSLKELHGLASSESERSATGGKTALGVSPALALAKDRTAAAATVLGLALSEPQTSSISHASPSEAAADLLTASGVTPSPAQQAGLVSLDGLAPASRSALTDLLDAFAGFQAANTKAYADADQAQLAKVVALAVSPAPVTAPVDGALPGGIPVLGAGLREPGELLRSTGLDLGPVLSARDLLVDAASAMAEARPAASALSKAAPDGPAVHLQAASPVPPAVSVPGVLAIDDVGVDNLYTANYLFVLDIGGNDIYQNNAGGSGLGAAALLDLAGDDEYGIKGGPGLNNGKNGGGTFGSGLLIDVEGDDVYTAGNNATNGGAGGGTGLLVDGGGNDVYKAGDLFTNGGGGSGVGGIVDAGGDDTYLAGDTATNGGGGTAGSGSLTDMSGTDSYTSYAPTGTEAPLAGDVKLPGTNGVNGAALLGTGRLYDGCGTGDTYLDGDGGTGTDKTVVPKGEVGAQIDSSESCVAAEPEPTTTTTSTTTTTTTTVPPTTSSTTTTTSSTTTTTVPPEYPPGASDSPWVKQEPVEPPLPPSAFHVMAYHPPTQRVVMFGGYTVDGEGLFPDELLQGTWTWDGSSWQRETPLTSPPSRQRAVMAYHARSEKLVLFSGTDGSSLSDTWTWDGSNWHQEAPAVGPPARNGASMAADGSGNVVLFGGVKDVVFNGPDPENATPAMPLDDTWTWDGLNWIEERPAESPPPRAGAAMAYHAPTKRAVLFGGRNEERPSAPFDVTYGDTWSWDGTNWASESPGPHPRENASMAFLEATGETVLFGAYSRPDSAGGDTWTWDGSSWTERNPQVRPTRRQGAGLAYHAPSGHVVLFGGRASSELNDTWTWEGKRTAGGIDPNVNRKVSLRPPSVPADGRSTSTATATYTVGGQGVSGLEVEFNTDGDVSFGPVRDHGDGRYTTTITASITDGDETIGASSSKYPESFLPARLTETPADLPRSCTAHPTSGSGHWTDLDPTFGCLGKITESVPPNNTGSGMAIQPDGRVVMAASNQLRRFTTEGTPDGSFGNAGVTKFTEDMSGSAGATDLALQRDRKILVLASEERDSEDNSGPIFSSRLYRFTTDGAPDLSFGPGGSVELDRGFFRVVVQDDGKIVVLGNSFELDGVPMSGAAASLLGLDTVPGVPHMRVVRYKTDGQVDLDFGPNGDGSVSFDFGVGFVPTGQGGVALQSDGKVVVVGSQCNLLAATYPHCDPAAGRLTTSGQLDPTFNPCGRGTVPCGGVVVTPFETPVGNAAVGGSAAGTSVAIQPDGKILLAGWGGAAEGVGFALIRYNVEVPGQPDGSLDSTFNPCVPAEPPCGGKQLAPTHFGGYQGKGSDGSISGPEDGGYANAVSVAQQPDRKIVLAGKGPAGAGDFLLARYNPDGTVDTCGTPGYVRTNFGLSSGALDVAVQPDGRIVAGGMARERGSEAVAMARYMGGGTESRVFSLGPVETRVNEPVSGPAEAAFQVSLDAPACQALSVAYATADGSATDGADYQGTKGEPLRVRFEANEDEKIVQVPVLADTAAEPDETFSLRLSDPRSEVQAEPLDPVFPRPFDYRIAVGQASATIVDASRRVDIEGATVPESFGGTVPMPFTVSLNGPVDKPVSVNYATADGSATAGDDYLPAGGTLSFEPGGPTSKTVLVDVLGDEVPEPTESLTMALSTGTPGAARFSNPNPVNVPLREAPRGCPPACPPDTAAPYPSKVSVRGLTGTVTDVNVTLRDLWWDKSGPSDADLMLVAPDGKSVILMSDACGDNDYPHPIARSAQVELTFDDHAGGPLPADTPCSSGSYRPLDDDDDTREFEGVGQPRPPDVFPEPAAPAPGSTLPLSSFNGIDPNGTWSLYLMDDFPNDPDPNKPSGRIVNGWSLSVATTTTIKTTAEPLNLILGKAVAEGFITDARPGVSVGDKKVTEGNLGRTEAVFTVTANGPATFPLTVEYRTTDGEATAGSDYEPTLGSLSFTANGPVAQTLTVPVVTDTLAEPDESFSVLIGATGSAVTDGEGVGTIVNDDAGIAGDPPNKAPMAPAPTTLAQVAPPQLVNPSTQPAAHGQTQLQQQAQSQVQVQAQAQAQQVVQQQAQQQVQHQVQTHGHAQSQGQFHRQAGLAGERSRETQGERAYVSGPVAEPDTHLAAGVRQPSPISPAALWGGLVTVGLVIALAQTTKAPTPAHQRGPLRPPVGQGRARLPTERIRGRHRRQSDYRWCIYKSSAGQPP
ncbi:MAG TPA: Calx-beta domain-containing protein [Acidimicrobiales bacterium]|nr:Calx-beta domain-containing protein [Acidimicrobiales bacterium]